MGAFEGRCSGEQGGEKEEERRLVLWIQCGYREGLEGENYIAVCTLYNLEQFCLNDQHILPGGAQ